MSTITVDPPFLSQLQALEEVTDLLDANGQIVGVFMPFRLEDQKRLAKESRKLFDLDKARLARQEDRSKAITTEELLKKLHAMETNS